MKLILAIIQHQDASNLVDALNEESYRVTRLSSQGGFLREGNVTLMLSVEDARLDHVIGVVREHCSTRTRYVSPMPPIAESGEFYPPAPLEVQVGGATIFVLNAEVDRLQV
ncbi:cyclic-di-AMP receptor [Candidatus Chloroploca sp. M-50]|uniref:Cyclic-di-AMP receptor n=1 Tax=Candidatus Chloroploca mongolica TaxID=2528176 RepID=A0ABS4DCT8_9CHLR|nr:cyclic-di-AMP receptor [Candidatus Chloroploca mongolica]MBP1467247.1 cyclic-di-AMP receptor [Candidatus Chloroploca mongolica]